jgi:hypothetical protein
MRLDASGLGIGTNSPSARLHVDAASSGSGLIVGYLNQTASQVNIGIGYRTAGHPFVGTNTNSNPLDIGTRSNTHTAFVTNDTERARFTAVGDFLVGLTSAQTWGIDGGGAFQVGGGRPCILGTSGGNISFKGDSGGWSMGLYANGSNNTYRGGFGFVGSADSLTYYWVGTAFNGTGVQLTSGGTSWSTLSDSRDKNIYGEIENALEKIGGIRSVYYSFKTDDQSAPRRVGFIAQEVQAVLPEAVSEVQRELENPTEESKRLMLSYTEVIPLLTKAIQEQQALITELRTRVAALEVK